MECLELFANRRSFRELSNERLNKNDIEAIIEAGMLAPVARGKYNTLVINVYENEKLDKIKKEFFNYLGRDIFFNCSLFILISQKDEIDDLMNQNAGTILENMLLEATNRNIGSVFVYSPVRIIRSKSELYNLFNIKEGYKPIAGAVFGKKTSSNTSKVEHKIEVIY